MKKLLWLSLLFLTASYSILGYFLSRWTAPWIVWVIVVVLGLGQAFLMTRISASVGGSVRALMSSEVGDLTAITLVALCMSVVLIWFNVFQFVLMVMATELLARVELQHSGVNSSKSLGMLTAIALLGLGMGWTLSTWV